MDSREECWFQVGWADYDGNGDPELKVCLGMAEGEELGAWDSRHTCMTARLLSNVFFITLKNESIWKISPEQMWITDTNMLDQIPQKKSEIFCDLPSMYTLAFKSTVSSWLETIRTYSEKPLQISGQISDPKILQHHRGLIQSLSKRNFSTYSVSL